MYYLKKKNPPWILDLLMTDVFTLILKRCIKYDNYHEYSL